MGTTAYVVLALVLLVAVVARVDLRVRGALASLRGRQADTNAATASAIGAVQRRVAVGPIPVTVRHERGLRGHRLVLDTGDVVLRLHRYGGSDLPRRAERRGDAGATGPVFLTRVSDEPDRGWQVQLAGLAGTSTYEGWLLERREAPTRVSGPGRAKATSTTT
jgi:hypothetical protein